MPRLQGFLAVCLVAVTLLAGCADVGKPSDAPAARGDDGRPLADGPSAWNYTTVHAGGAAFTKTYEGVLTPDEASQGGGGFPAGASVYGTPLESCCSMDFVEAPDLLVDDQLLSARITVTWSNTETDRAGFDVAVCVPWNCVAFNYGPDESSQAGEHTDTLDFITGGDNEFGVGFVGVRYTNAAIATGLTYMVVVDAVPIENGLRFADPYEIQVSQNATLTLELVGPYSSTITGGLMFYGEDDRPIHYHPFEGPHGSRQDLTLPEGEYVVFPFRLRDGFPRLSTSVAPESLELRLLAEEFGELPVATVPDAQAHAGTYEYVAEPGSMDSVPFFIYTDGPAVQDLMGLGLERPGGRVSMASSSGLIIELDFARLAAQAAGEVFCLQCITRTSTFEPAHYIDDDGAYQVEWSSEGAAGNVVMFTVKYVR